MMPGMQRVPPPRSARWPPGSKVRPPRACLGGEIPRKDGDEGGRERAFGEQIARKVGNADAQKEGVVNRAGAEQPRHDDFAHHPGDAAHATAADTRRRIGRGRDDRLLRAQARTAMAIPRGGLPPGGKSPSSGLKPQTHSGNAPRPYRTPRPSARPPPDCFAGHRPCVGGGQGIARSDGADGIHAGRDASPIHPRTRL